MLNTYCRVELKCVPLTPNCSRMHPPRDLDEARPGPDPGLGIDVSVPKKTPSKASWMGRSILSHLICGAVWGGFYCVGVGLVLFVGRLASQMETDDQRRGEQHHRNAECDEKPDLIFARHERS